jgi:hypothetical protein
VIVEDRSKRVKYPGTVKCRYCGEQLTHVEAKYGRVCSSDECQREDRDAEIERDEMARQAAQEDGYSRYGGGGNW